jgi:hypothetical protein
MTMTGAALAAPAQTQRKPILDRRASQGRRFTSG